jgi:regulator of cell morphogenesis and NO signaling
MYITNKTFVKSEMKISDIVRENPRILLVLEHFGIDDVLQDKTVSMLCGEYEIEELLFIVICNLYNGFNVGDAPKINASSIQVLIRYLSNSHLYYLNEKYPEITDSIKKLSSSGQQKEMKLVEAFFNEYFEEVMEHLDYEEKVAFPYFSSLLENRQNTAGNEFSATDYQNHHTDIESKLTDLKNLLLQHIRIQNQGIVKRKLLYSLFELEFDLKIHSLIEDQILVPLVMTLENKATK